MDRYYLSACNDTYSTLIETIFMDGRKRLAGRGLLFATVKSDT